MDTGTKIEIIVISVVVIACVVVGFLFNLRNQWDGGPPIWAARLAAFGLAALAWVGGWGLVVAMSIISAGGMDGEPPGIVQTIGWPLIFGSPIAAVIIFKKLYGRTESAKYIGLGKRTGQPILKVEGTGNSHQIGVASGVVFGIASGIIVIVGLLVALLIWAIIAAIVVMCVAFTAVFVTTMLRD